ncbi:hypothetical protein ACHAXM_005607 [Skeletonema potamos]|jgi:hypothetical protein
MVVIASSMPTTRNHPRGRCVPLEENDGAGAGALLRAAQAIDASHQDHDDNNALGKGGGEFSSYLSSIYRPRRTISADEAAAIADQVMSSMKRQLSYDVDGKAPPKKISRKKHLRRVTEVVFSCVDNNHGDGLNHPTIIPTHLMFTLSPMKAPKKVPRTKRRLLCSAIGCSNTSFHNGGVCFNHGGKRAINPINLFSA